MLILSATASATASDWTKADTARQIHFWYTLTNDWRQTKDIHKLPGHHENNKILGKHLDEHEVTRYFAACAVGHALISYALPGKWRKTWQMVWIGIQSNQIQENDLYLKQPMGMSYRLTHTVEF